MNKVIETSPNIIPPDMINECDNIIDVEKGKKSKDTEN